MTLGRVRDYVATGVTTVLGLSLLAGMLLPVYTDEVGWRFQERAAIDGFDKMFSDGCGANTLAVPPFFMLPVRHFSALLNQLFADPLFVRLSGVGYALLLVWLIGRLLQRIARDPSERAVLRIIVLGLLALGLMPLLLVWSRPEQPLILSLVGALLIASAGWPTAAQASNRQIALRCRHSSLLAPSGGRK